MESHLLQMRGLKHSFTNWFTSFPVASFTDAWIETWIMVQMGCPISSHLLQMRGLKPPKPKLPLPKMGRIFYRCVD